MPWENLRDEVEAEFQQIEDDFRETAENLHLARWEELSRRRGTRSPEKARQIWKKNKDAYNEQRRQRRRALADEGGEDYEELKRRGRERAAKAYQKKSANASAPNKRGRPKKTLAEKKESRK